VKVIKTILIGFGIIFVLLVAFISYVAVQSGKFEKEHAPFVKSFMAEFSKDWDVSAVEHLLTPEFIDQIDTSSGREAMRQFRQLGRLKEITELNLDHFSTHAGTNSYKYGVFVLRAEFEHATTMITLSLVVDENGARVEGLRINPTGDFEPDRPPDKIAI